jgi:hypothetical protein
MAEIRFSFAGISVLPMPFDDSERPVTAGPLHSDGIFRPARYIDKGKTTERWRRKVSGLKGESPTIAGPPNSQSV